MQTESGFKAMSQSADADHPKGEGASDLQRRHADTDELAEVVTDRASELQRLIVDEIRDRPFRALGWAAATGFVLGIWVSR